MMSDTTISTAAVKNKKPVNLPAVLEDASIDDVVLEEVRDKTTNEALQESGKPVMTATSIHGVDFNTLKVDQIRMLCSLWKLKKYRSAPREDLCILIAQNKLLTEVYEAQAFKVTAKKEELQASKFRLLNVLFSADFYDDVVKMNDKKQKNELDAGKAGNNQRLWSSISDAYNDSANNEAYGLFAFVEDDQIGEFAKKFDITSYVQLDWLKATGWFKEIVSDYELALSWYTKSGEHEPNFFHFCRKKPQTYYYRLYVVDQPNSHKAFSAVLDDTIFSESTSASKLTGKQSVNRGDSATGLKRKEEAISRVADNMTDKFLVVKNRQITDNNRKGMRTEKMELERDTTTYYINVCSLPDSADGNSAREFMNSKIENNTNRIAEITKWLENNPST
jgi:hypothetical protein